MIDLSMTLTELGKEGYPPEIIGYAEPWIVSPGDSVAIKVSTIAQLNVLVTDRHPEMGLGFDVKKHSRRPFGFLVLFCQLEH